MVDKVGFDLIGKVALVTGAGRGLGAQISEDILRAGGSVMLAARKRPDQLMRQLNEKYPGRAGHCTLNVENEQEWIEAVDACVATFQGLDVLVNNAGIEIQALLTDCTLEDFRNLMRVNVEGSFLGMKHSVRAMRPGGIAGKGGSIVNISSAAGLTGVPSATAYSATKGAMRMMSKSAAVECALLDYGIRINSLHPGLVKTDMGVDVINGFFSLGLVPSEEAAEEYVASLHPIGLGTPKNVSDAVLFLAGETSAWITGAELACDGGFSA